MLRIGALEIDRGGREVRVAGKPVGLTPTEYRLLLELAEHSGVVCSRERLLEEVWGYVWAATPGWSTCTSAGCGRRSAPR